MYEVLHLIYDVNNIYGKPTSCRHASKCWMYINLHLILT